MPDITITINTDNAAFHEDDREGESPAAAAREVARILRKLADDVEASEDVDCTQRPYGANGNAVGAVAVKQ